jgi:hypothetical protein
MASCQNHPMALIVHEIIIEEGSSPPSAQQYLGTSGTNQLGLCLFTVNTCSPNSKICEQRGNKDVLIQIINIDNFKPMEITIVLRRDKVIVYFSIEVTLSSSLENNCDYN